VQHISADFVLPMANWLSTISHLPIQIAQANERPIPGTIYLAPSNQHLQFTGNRHFEMSTTPKDVRHIPSGNILLTSVAQRYGSSAIGIVLTGMGDDGARGLRAMYESGAITVAQDEASCVVFGMPQEAIALDAARLVLPPREISQLLIHYSSYGC
jgi:two-component system chemotaxis response regulator CheB